MYFIVKKILRETMKL